MSYCHRFNTHKHLGWYNSRTVCIVTVPSRAPFPGVQRYDVIRTRHYFNGWIIFRQLNKVPFWLTCSKLKQRHSWPTRPLFYKYLIQNKPNADNGGQENESNLLLRPVSCPNVIGDKRKFLLRTHKGLIHVGSLRMSHSRSVGGFQLLCLGRVRNRNKAGPRLNCRPNLRSKTIPKTGCCATLTLLKYIIMSAVEIRREIKEKEP